MGFPSSPRAAIEEPRPDTSAITARHKAVARARVRRRGPPPSVTGPSPLAHFRPAIKRRARKLTAQTTTSEKRRVEIAPGGGAAAARGARCDLVAIFHVYCTWGPADLGPELPSAVGAL
ncbi:hypothetical protein EVAR_60856_1 [Eumeta japonica]|uniref:Uncharacterized protein n=1 Tax=Eumeta variegata TaxID=151549 RepID=A0A4C1Y734_EUMVA|nr:hypothetical protein EVAR_60856_1 [Eumeta japonica]